MPGNCCSLVHHISGVCNTCPNNEECNLKVILEMKRKLDDPTKPVAELTSTYLEFRGEAID